MNKATMITRIILGLIFFVFGLNGFLNFIPTPTEMPEAQMKFMTGLMATKYFFPFLKGTETLTGLMLLSGVFVPLALVVLAPIIINIFLLHIFMSPEGLPMALFIGALEIYLAFFSKPYSDIVKQIFRCPKYESMKK